MRLERKMLIHDLQFEVKKKKKKKKRVTAYTLKVKLWPQAWSTTQAFSELCLSKKKVMVDEISFDFDFDHNVI
jgi:hypothetical protein